MTFLIFCPSPSSDLLRYFSLKLAFIFCSRAKNVAKNLSKPASAKSKAAANTMKSDVAMTNGGQTRLTSYFPVRRSERRPKHETELEMQKLIEHRLLVDNDEGLDLEIRNIPEKASVQKVFKRNLKGTLKMAPQENVHLSLSLVTSLLL